MICVNCGKNLPDNAKFCGSCGSKISAPPQNAQMHQAPHQQMHQQYQAQASPQPPYQAYNSPMPPHESGGSVMSVGRYLLTLIIAGIPIIGFVVLLVWSFGSGTDQNKKNLSRALLCLIIITAILYFIFGSLLMSRFTRMMY